MTDTAQGIFGGTQVQDLGRRVNNRIQRQIEPEQGLLMWAVCECANCDCQAIIIVTVQQYAGVRKDDYRFLVLAGHQTPAVDHVVEGGKRWLVVEKIDEHRHCAEEMAVHDRDRSKHRAFSWGGPLRFAATVTCL